MTSYNPFNQFIEECGLSKYYSGGSDLEVRLYHDLNIYGDIAESCIETLRGNYNVDISQFNFYDYFPPEFEGKSTLQSLLFSLIPFLAAKQRASREYAKLTFGDIKNAIESGSLK